MRFLFLRSCFPAPPSLGPASLYMSSTHLNNLEPFGIVQDLGPGGSFGASCARFPVNVTGRESDRRK